MLINKKIPLERVKKALLEEMKPTLDISNKNEAKEIFEEFVFTALAYADKKEKDKSEKVTQETAKNFATIALLIEVMETFECLSEEWQERKQYCIFKAGHIQQCLAKKKTPKRGNPFKEKDLKKDHHPLVPLPQDPPDEGGIRAALLPSKTTQFRKPLDSLKEPEERKFKDKDKVVDFYASTFGDIPGGDSANDHINKDGGYPQIDFFDQNMSQRRSKGFTVVSGSRDMNSRAIGHKKGIKNGKEIKKCVQAAMSNLTYYKPDLAIEELENALEMLKDEL